MKYFAWIESAVQATANDSKGSQRRDDNKDSSSSTSSESIKDVELQTEETSTEPVHLDALPTLKSSNPSTNLDIWKHVEPVSGANMPEMGQHATVRPVSTNVPIRSSMSDLGKIHGALKNTRELPEEPSLAFDYNPAIADYISSGHVQNPRSLRRRNMSSASTIFQNSPLTPIIIIVTTPDEPTPSPEAHNPFNAIRAHRQSSSLPSSRLTSLSTSNLIPDPNRLKPPTERQINASKLTKAHEFHEIRQFLIGFLNVKGDQFPKKLRCRIMEMYCITAADLSPEVVAKFTDVITDEGVALEQVGISEPETTGPDDLRILQMAFMSQLPAVTPRKEPVPEEPRLPTRGRKQSLIGRRAEARKEEDPLPWLSLTTTNASLAAPPLDSPPPRPVKHKLLRGSSSVPDLRVAREADVPPVPPILSTSTSNSPVKRHINNILSSSSAPEGMRPVEKKARSKKNNVFMGVFGAVRQAITASKEARAREKRILLKDAVL